MARVRKVFVQLERKVSDGNYGSYGGIMQEEIVLEEGDDDPGALALIVKQSRLRCAIELNKLLVTSKELGPAK